MMIQIPIDVLSKNTSIKTLDLSYNNIKKVESLESFKQLTSLVLDNNRIGSNNTFPNLPNLKTLSLNNNDNPACPNYYFTGLDFNDYQKYRYYILYHLKNLKFLDSTPVTPEEIKEAERQGIYSIPAKPTQQDIIPDEVDEDEPVYKSLSSELAQEGKGKASFGVSTYVYYGRQSEDIISLISNFTQSNNSSIVGSNHQNLLIFNGANSTSCFEGGLGGH
ncbi:hypothetical protein ACTFIU_010757, partial [Dictyostelium citrinum]